MLGSRQVGSKIELHWQGCLGEESEGFHPIAGVYTMQRARVAAHIQLHIGTGLSATVGDRHRLGVQWVTERIAILGSNTIVVGIIRIAAPDPLDVGVKFGIGHGCGIKHGFAERSIGCGQQVGTVTEGSTG